MCPPLTIFTTHPLRAAFSPTVQTSDIGQFQAINHLLCVFIAYRITLIFSDVEQRLN